MPTVRITGSHLNYLSDSSQINSADLSKEKEKVGRKIGTITRRGEYCVKLSVLVPIYSSRKKKKRKGCSGVVLKLSWNKARRMMDGQFWCPSYLRV